MEFCNHDSLFSTSCRKYKDDVCEVGKKSTSTFCKEEKLIATSFSKNDNNDKLNMKYM